MQDEHRVKIHWLHNTVHNEIDELWKVDSTFVNVSPDRKRYMYLHIAKRYAKKLQKF